MNRIIIILFLSVLIFEGDLFGQELVEEKDEIEKVIVNRFTGISSGFYLDNGVHPGIKLGTSYLLGSKEKSKQRRIQVFKKQSEKKLKQIEMLIDGNLGFYNHPNNHTGMFIGLGFTRQRIQHRVTRRGLKKTKLLGWSFETNYLRRNYNIDVFSLDTNGEIQEIKRAGTNSLMFALSPSVGRIYNNTQSGRDIHFYAKPSIQLLKYNHSFFPNAALELGINFNIF